MRAVTTELFLLGCLDSLRRDLGHGFRTLRKSPLFASMAVLSIALGIGANTTIFTVTKHVVLDSLPVPDASQLVILHNPGSQQGHVSSDGMASSFSYPLYRDLNAASSSVFSGTLARIGASATLTRPQSSERVACELVSGNYFGVLGVQPWRGRFIAPSDNRTPGAHPVVVISYGFWKGTLGSDPNILNSAIRLNGHPFQVIGIAPPGFYGIRIDSAPAIYVPLMMAAQITPDRNDLTDRLDHWAGLVGRMRAGVTLAQAEAALSVLYPPLRNQDIAFMHHPDASFLQEFQRNQIKLAPGGQGYASIRDQLREPLQFLDGLALLVLLITLVNVANLLIARGTAREREMAVRLSVGAGRAMLVRQLLIESLALALSGGIVGVAFAYAATPLLLRLLGSDLSSSSIGAHPDTGMLLFTAGLAILSGVAFGLLPALQSAGTNTAVALKADGSFGHTSARLWLRRALIAGQIGFSLILLTAALLFTQSLRNLQNIHPGFATHGLLTFKVNPLEAGYDQPRIRSFGETLRSRLNALPGVQSVGIATVPLLEDDDEGSNITVEGYSAKHGEDTDVLHDQVSPRFLETLQIPLLAGRTFTDADSLQTSKVAVVNATFVKKFFRTTNPLGRHFHYGGGNKAYDWTIVGIAADNQHNDLRSKIQPFAYEPYLVSNKLSALTFYVRSGNTAAISAAIRQSVRSLDASLPVYDLTTVDENIAGSLVAERGLAVLSGLFAVLAIVLAVIGLYGLVAYSVTRRRREFGIRLAIGASPARVLQSVIKETALLGGISILCTLPLLFAAGRFARSLLYQVEPADPILCGSAVLLLFIVAVLAGLIPARTAARIDPQQALRAD
jgi:predicted permease